MTQNTSNNTFDQMDGQQPFAKRTVSWAFNLGLIILAMGMFAGWYFAADDGVPLEKVETEHYENVIETYSQYEWSGKGVECKYELHYETNWGDWIDKDDYEFKDGFHIFDGVDREWMNDEVKKGIIERNSSIYDGDWKQLGLDLGIVEDEG